MSKLKKWLLLLGLLVLLAAVTQIPVGDRIPEEVKGEKRGTAMDLSAFSMDRPETQLRLLFIHHSCGGQLMADPGTLQSIATCIHPSHTNGGGLRKLLQAAGYEIHQASYGSEIGDKTDLFDWLPKFRDKMEKVLSVDLNDRPLPEGKKNQIVLFKSCYPNNALLREGEAPGNPAGPDLTFWNAKASMAALLPEFAKRPEVLFVYMTAPPLAPKGRKEPLWKWMAKKILGKPAGTEGRARSGVLARQFNDWVKSPDGWLKDYRQKNVVVFDLYDVLTDYGASNLSRYPTGDGSDSHPSQVGNGNATAEFLPFLNRAVRRAGLSK